MSDPLHKGLVAIAVIAAILNVYWIVTLNDYSYAGVAAPVAMVGAGALMFASIIRWQHWYSLLAITYAIPFLPWVDWMYD